MKGAGALLFAIVFIVCCSLSVATSISEEHPIQSAISEEHPVKSAISEDHPIKSAISEDHPNHPIKSAISENHQIKSAISEEHPIKSAISEERPMKSAISEDHPIKSAISEDHPIKIASVSDITDLNYGKEVKQVEGKKPVEPIGLGPRWVFPSEYRPWPKFIFKPRPFVIRNIEESMDQSPNVEQKSTHIDMDIDDDNVDRVLEKASHLLNRMKEMKNKIKSNDGFFFLLPTSVNQNAQPHTHLAKAFLPLLNKVDRTVKKLAGVTVEHKQLQDFPKPPELKPQDERRGLIRLYNRVKALEDTVHFLTWIVLILLFVLLFLCVTVFLWVSCRLSPNVKQIESGEKGVKLATGRFTPQFRKTMSQSHRVIPNTFRI